MAIVTVGIDTAKSVFAVHGVDEAGKVQLRQPKVARAKLNALMAELPPCTIGIEACTGAHYWARQFQAHGHTVKLMAPKLVAPYRMSGKRGKNDAADAAAICEAVSRANMRFVPAKTEDQQARLMVHRARQGYVTARTATINRIRGLLAEFGVVLPLKAEVVRREAANKLEELPGYANLVIGDLLSEVHHLDERIGQYDIHIRTMARQSTPAQQLMQLMGIGEVTATALVATVGNAREFGSSRQFAAWLGLVPGQYSSGGKTRLGGHHQGRRRLPAWTAGHRRAGGAQCGGEQERSLKPLGHEGGPAAGILEGRGGDCGEERAHGLGGADQGRELQSAGVKDRVMKPEERTTHPPALPASGKGAPTTSESKTGPRAASSPH
jgi:transposase